MIILSGSGSVTAGGGSFFPQTLATLAFFLNAHSISGSDGDPVVDALDSSGGGHHYGQDTIARQPTLKTNLYAGGTRNAIRFGANKCLVPDPFPAVLSAANTLWIVCTPSTTQDYIFAGSTSVGSGPAFISAFSSKAFEYFWHSSGADRSTFLTSGTGLRALLMTYQDNSGNYVGYLDGNSTPVFTVAINSGRDWSGKQIETIGGLNPASTAYTGDIVEMGFCSSVLTGSDLTNLLNYLASLL